MGKFNDKVVVITGAGGGIGRAHALGFAKEGAKVVVNDLGGARDGKGQSEKVADTVVKEILDLGGEAIANYDSVADMVGAQNIIKTAIDTYGRIDFLVNNAGILRDKTFLKMSEEQWDLVIAVHLKGAFAVTKSAIPYMIEQGFGRIINTSSSSGLLGNFGQANYAAAKAGLYGFTRTLALEFERYGVTVNVLAPIAKTRMTADVDAVPEDMTPDQITPIVLYLCSDEAKNVTGRVFGIAGQQIFEYKMIMTQGVEKETKDLWTIDEIHKKLEDITRQPTEQVSAGGNLHDLLPKLNQLLESLGVQITPLGDMPASTTTKPTEVTLSDMFQKMTEVFLPAKAAGFNGLIQFVISGDKPQALYFENNKLKIKVEQGNNPACTITTDKESMLSMLQGKSDPTKLFMKGKIKTDKMPILMKFNTMFNMKALPEKIKALEASTKSAQSTATTLSTEDDFSIHRIFEKMAEVFLPDKAGTWKGIIQFDIPGSPHAIYIDNGKVQIKPEMASSPDCTIKTDVDSMVAMAKGESDPTKLFMKGKIKADKMPILMKFNNMFKVQDLQSKLNKTHSTASIASTGITTTSGTLSDTFQQLKDVFVPSKARSFSGLIQFLIKDDQPQAVTVSDNHQTVIIESKKGDKPALIIRTDKEHALKLLKGELNTTKALMQGKLKVDHTNLLLRFQKMFDLQKLGAKISMPTGSESSDKEEGGMNREFIGRWFNGPAEHVKPERVRQYAKATNETNKSYLSEDIKALVVPPVFPVIFMKELFETVLTEPDLGMDLLRMVHAEHDIRYFRPLKSWDLVYPVAEVLNIEKKSSGELMTVKISGRVSGLDVFEMHAKFFVRGTSQSKSKSQTKKEEDFGTPSFTQTMKVASDQTERYAEASGDTNPIHLDEDTAKAAGLSGRILHGLCTMAFAGQAIVEKYLGGDAQRLTRLKVRFSKPVLLTDELTTKGWVTEENGKKIIKFETVTAKDVKVITQGIAEFS